MSPPALLPVLLLAAAAADALSGRLRGGPTRLLAPAAAAGALALAASIARSWPEVAAGGIWWTGAGAGEYRFRLGWSLDAWSPALLLLVALLTLAGRFLAADPSRLPRLWLGGALLALLAMADNLPMAWLAWAGLSACAVRDGRPLGPPLAGTLSLAAGVAAASASWGTTNLADIGMAAQWDDLPRGLPVTAALLVLGAAVAAVLTPLARRGNAPDPVTGIAFPIVAAGALLARLDPVVAASGEASFATVAAGLSIAIVCPAAALRERRAGRIALLLACSQAGIVLLGLGIGVTGEALVHLQAAALAAALLASSAALVAGGGGDRDGAPRGGALAAMPGAGRLLLAASAASALVPPFAGYFSGAVIVDAASRIPGAGEVIRAAACAGIALGAAAAARLATSVLLGPAVGDGPARRDPPAGALAVPGLLALLLVAAGFLSPGRLAAGGAVPVAAAVAAGAAAGALPWRRRRAGASS